VTWPQITIAVFLLIGLGNGVRICVKERHLPSWAVTIGANFSSVLFWKDWKPSKELLGMLWAPRRETRAPSAQKGER